MKNIIVALNTVMKSCGYIQKTGKNAFHGYKYAGEADLLEKLRPAMVEAGLILLPSVTEQSAIDEFGNTRVRIEYTLAHVSGEVWPHPIVAQGCGNDRNKNGVGDKGLYKAITGANKYLLFKLFQIETGDDPEATEAAAEPVKKPTASAAKPVTDHGQKAPPSAEQAVSDWQIVAAEMVKEVKACQSNRDVDIWMHDHGKQISTMEKHAPDIFAEVKSAVVSHRATFNVRAG